MYFEKIRILKKKNNLVSSFSMKNFSQIDQQFVHKQQQVKSLVSIVYFVFEILELDMYYIA